MYSVSVKSHMFIAHSLDHPDFGPAQNIHGATLELVVTVYRKNLDGMNVVIDIGYLRDLIGNIVENYNYKNLDDLDEFQDTITSIDYLCNHFYNILRIHLNKNELLSGDNPLHSMKVEIFESPDACASYSSDF